MKLERFPAWVGVNYPPAFWVTTPKKSTTTVGRRTLLREVEIVCLRSRLFEARSNLGGG